MVNEAAVSASLAEHAGTSQSNNPPSAVAGKRDRADGEAAQGRPRRPAPAADAAGDRLTRQPTAKAAHRGRGAERVPHPRARRSRSALPQPGEQRHPRARAAVCAVPARARLRGCRNPNRIVPVKLPTAGTNRADARDYSTITVTVPTAADTRIVIVRRRFW